VANPILGLEGKTALVVGGGGVGNQGIGASTSLLFAEAGAKVMVADNDAGRAADMVALIRDKGGDAAAIVVDATDPAEVDRMVAATLDQFGALDCMATIIGGAGAGAALECTDARWERDMLLNVKYAWYCNRAAGASMIARNVKGSIVNLSSVRSLTGSYQQMSYGVGKAGLNSLVRTLAVEWGEHDIRVNAVAPGATSAPSLNDMFKRVPGMEKRMSRLIPLGRIATPDEIAGVILFLASRLAAFVTGQTILADGAYFYNHAMVMYRDDEDE
jgi:NAD(P)-dependent dehydrogenase (short-subunit alcohol dehydrogenase family)